MNNLTFKLEGVVKSKNEMEDFEGPLNLILLLLSKNKIEIRDIQISLILDQYIAYLEEMKSMDLEIASEFVAMASHLVYIKTKTLLAEDDQEVSELDELISSLESLKNKDIYSSIKAVTGEFETMFKSGAGTFVKAPENIQKTREYNYSHKPEDILNALIRIVRAESEAGKSITFNTVAIPQVIRYPVGEKSDEIVRTLGEKGSLKIKELFQECTSRTELVATLLALLELCKDGYIVFAGTDDMSVMRGESVPDIVNS